MSRLRFSARLYWMARGAAERLQTLQPALISTLGSNDSDPRRRPDPAGRATAPGFVVCESRLTARERARLSFFASCDGGKRRSGHHRSPDGLCAAVHRPIKPRKLIHDRRSMLLAAASALALSATAAAAAEVATTAADVDEVVVTGTRTRVVRGGVAGSGGRDQRQACSGRAPRSWGRRWPPWPVVTSRARRSTTHRLGASGDPARPGP